MFYKVCFSILELGLNINACCILGQKECHSIFARFQDVFSLYDSDGKINSSIKGYKPVNEAINLLVYYYQ